MDHDQTICPLRLGSWIIVVRGKRNSSEKIRGLSHYRPPWNYSPHFGIITMIGGGGYRSSEIGILKIRNLELFIDGKKVDLGDNHEGWWLGFINILLINTRSLASMQRRSKFANAVMLNDYNNICACETWLKDNISSSELLLDNYTIYRSDRKQDAENNTQGGAMIAIRNSLASEQLNTDPPDCSLTCRLEINKLSLFCFCVLQPLEKKWVQIHTRGLWNTSVSPTKKQHSNNLWRSKLSEHKLAQLLKWGHWRTGSTRTLWKQLFSSKCWF